MPKPGVSLNKRGQSREKYDSENKSCSKAPLANLRPINQSLDQIAILRPGGKRPVFHSRSSSMQQILDHVRNSPLR